ncbi:MAG: UvrD-helicase domain-containing protein [Candidatus Amulumruptor caecigallinarius]|nr:UvrD-helicase domain-containing protein [Candidatus Amulumruptor caecigallinarius]
MIDLQRASAGSGKTFTLARQYIRFLISIKPEEENAPRRLRTVAELHDSAKHILAVTFTNKATGEMQSRIVEKLYELAYPKSTASRDEAPDYMFDFMEEFGVTAEDVSRVSQKALKVLLNNYSDFHVSTIDSFFQQVLRTFAYETNLNDSYHVELDTEFIARESIDSVLEQLDTAVARPGAMPDEGEADAAFWVQVLMDRAEKNNWNMFRKHVAGKNNFGPEEEQPYSALVKSVGRLENEEYKLIRGEVEDYFDSDVDFKEIYRHMVRKYDKPAADAFAHLKKCARDLYDHLIPDILSESTRTDVGALHVATSKIIGKPDDKYAAKWDTAVEIKKCFNDEYFKKGTVRKFSSEHPEMTIVRPFAEAFAAAYDNWMGVVGSKEFLFWKIYKRNIPYLALFKNINKFRRDYLSENNAVELGETNMILRSVTGGEETPFIYERLGTRLNHFLIDEFQDTSKMQWENFYPLIRESISYNNDNLIIGDPKQSIYRFRNADHTLIQKKVPAQFKGFVNLLGDKVSENTNWRSELRVVQFNNSIFRHLAEKASGESKPGDDEIARLDFRDLYSNVVQYPHNQKLRGYVELRKFIGKKEDFNAWVLPQIPELVVSLHQRGYAWKDIAVLVSINADGDAVISEFMKHNLAAENAAPRIPFVSEQSLKIGNSAAVKLVVNILESISRGAGAKINRNEATRAGEGMCKWRDIMANFRYFSIKNPGLPLAERIGRFVDSSTEVDTLSEMLQNIQSMAVPSLVETIIATFMSSELRKRDAVYLSAFQDAVLEYCDAYPSDIASFINWWNRKKESISISSPEGTDAVQVMTVHKSKGLEFKCVIIPFANWSLKDSDKKSEWRWVKPESSMFDGFTPPPYIPVNVNSDLKESPYRNLLFELYDLNKMDGLNAAYVAFTRAKKELYVFGLASKKRENEKKDIAVVPSGIEMREERDKEHVLPLIFSQLEEMCKVFSESNGNFESEITGVNPKDIERTELPPAVVKIAVGTPADLEKEAEEDMREKEEKAKEKAKNGEEAKAVGTGATGKEDTPEDLNRLEIKTDKKVLTDYRSVKMPSYLKFRQELLTHVVNADEYDEDDIDDPRAEGNLYHAILEQMITFEGLDESVKNLRVQGLMTRAEAEEKRKNLSKWLSNPRVKSWFDGSGNPIMERPILKKGEKFHRPDRVVEYPDGSAVVIDYKFGAVRDDGKYDNQVKTYVRRLLKTGKYTGVTGYLWYVKEDKIMGVEP